MQWLRRHEKFEMEHWSVHDLRRTARTNFSTLTEPHIAEIMLGHRMPGAWQVYDHYDYLPEQAKACTAWAKRLESLTVVVRNLPTNFGQQNCSGVRQPTCVR